MFADVRVSVYVRWWVCVCVCVFVFSYARILSVMIAGCLRLFVYVLTERSATYT